MEHSFIVARQGKVFHKTNASLMRLAVERARREIMGQEDSRIFKALDHADVHEITWEVK